MIVLRAIGNFFVKIWNWIKNTAWVQPLLIVGAIFAVIFSIPSITSWVQSIAANWNSSDQFYADRKVTLYGGEKSDAYKLFDDVYNEEASKYENKFFLVFVSSSCSACESCMDGFKVLNDNWNSTYIPNNSGEKFAMHTIYVDEAPDDFTETPTYST